MVIIQSDLWMADVDGMIILMKDLLFRPKNTQDMRPPIPNLPLATHWIRSTLNIAKRALPQIEGHLSFKLGNLHQRMMPFDSKTLPYFEQG